MPSFSVQHNPDMDIPTDVFRSEATSDPDSDSVSTSNLIVENNNFASRIDTSDYNTYNSRYSKSNEYCLDNDFDPDTDNEEHARSQILRHRAMKSHNLMKRLAPSGSISILPSEVLCLIFSNIHSKRDLISVALTCKYWANLVISTIWFRPGINNKGIAAKLKTTLTKPVHETQWNYRNFIKRLNLSLITSIVDDAFLDLFAPCTNLERITLVNCSHLTHQSTSRLLEGCTRLQSIDLTGVRDIQDQIYYQLATHCKRLQGLYAPGSSNISQEAVLSLIENCPLLKRVKLSDCNNINDDIIFAMIKNCPNLVELDLHGCEKITNAALNAIFSQLEFLKEFKISKNANITYELFEYPYNLIASLEKLRILDFTQCPNITDKAVIKFIKLSPRLRNVVLSKCSAITDASLRAIATLGKNLHYIHLGHCGNITDVGAKELIKNCYRLQYIDLACCNQLTNATVVEISKLAKLRRIGLVKCSQITDEGILALAENARLGDDTLERVHLSYCSNLTIYPVYKLLKSCPKLTHISLTGITQFLRPDITRFCRDPPSDFSPHQQSIFCVFSGEGVNLLRSHLSHIIQTTEYEDVEATEIMQIINGVIGTTQPIDTAVFTPNIRDRFDQFVNNSIEFLRDYERIDVDADTVTLFARCIFNGVQQTQATRVHRFLQLMHDRPGIIRRRERYRQAQMDHQIMLNRLQRQRQLEQNSFLRVSDRFDQSAGINHMADVQNMGLPLPAADVTNSEVYRAVNMGLPESGRNRRNGRDNRPRADNVDVIMRDADDSEPEGRQLANIPAEAVELFRFQNQDID